jgi:hypothetical protein
MRREWIICCLLAAITLAVYWPVRHQNFVCYDDGYFGRHKATRLTRTSTTDAAPGQYYSDNNLIDAKLPPSPERTYP